MIARILLWGVGGSILITAGFESYSWDLRRVALIVAITLMMPHYKGVNQ